MVKKTTKKKKPIKSKIKTKKVTKDTKQDQELKSLKKELKKLAKQVLDNAKKKLPKDKFRKLRSSILDKIPLAKTRAKIDKLSNNLLRTPYQNIPSQLARDAQSSLITAKQEVKKSIRDELDNEFKEPIKAYNKMKKDLNDVIEKYNNGELSIVEVAVAYKSAKKFANIVGEYLPTASELNSTYRSVKNKLNYLRGWVSSRLRSGDSITEIQNLPPPPPPPPSPSPDPPPEPELNQEPEPELNQEPEPELNQEPEPELNQEPEPELNQEPDQSTMYDTARQTIENLNPFVQRTGTALIGLGMLEGATRFYNRLTNTGRNREIVRDRMEDAGGRIVNQIAQQTSQSVLDELNRRQMDNINTIRNIRERMNRDSLERLSNRARLRQRDRDIQQRQQMGNNIVETEILERSVSTPQRNLVRNPLFGIKSRTKEFVTPSTARRNQNRLDAEEGQADLRSRIMEQTEQEQEVEDVEEVDEDIEEVDEEMPDLV